MCDGARYLHRDERTTDDDLGLGRDEVGPLGGALAGVEDACDSVSLGEEGSVHHGEAEPCAKPANNTSIS